jgi:hypothetical protein
MNTLKTLKIEVPAEAKGFICNPNYTDERLGDYDLMKEVREKWETTEPLNGGCGNIGSYFYLGKNGRFYFAEDYDFNAIGIYRAISEAHLLLRLLCCFGKAPQVHPIDDQYKCVWSITVKHKETGETLQFGSWKGAVGICHTTSSHKKLPNPFLNDICDLVTYLCSPQCAHPYDNLTAGGVA